MTGLGLPFKQIELSEV